MVAKTPRPYECQICGRNLHVEGEDHHCWPDQVRDAYNQAVEDCRRVAHNWYNHDDEGNEFAYMVTLDSAFDSLVRKKRDE